MAMKKTEINFDDIGESSSKHLNNDLKDVQPKLDFALQHKPLIIIGFYCMLSGLIANIYLVVKLISLIF